MFHALARLNLRPTLLTLALSAGFSCASAQVFTFTPTAVGLTGASVTADNILLSDFSSVMATGATTFSETGFLSLSGFQLGGTNITAGGLNSTYSLYIPFSGTGHLPTSTNA